MKVYYVSMHAPPSFGSSLNLEALALGLNKGVENKKEDGSNDDYLSRYDVYVIHKT